jgi:Transposase DDE domain group 1
MRHRSFATSTKHSKATSSGKVANQYLLGSDAPCGHSTSSHSSARGSVSLVSRCATGQARGLKAHGSIEEVARIVTQIRARWPAVRILLRADSGFARDGLMSWCETNSVDFLFGLARNTRLVGEIEAELAAAAELSQLSGKPARRFKDFAWRTRDSWSHQRRVVAKAEWLPGGTPGTGEANPRFVVTSLSREEHQARHLYEKLYCARGEMENRIKECQLDLYADRTSAQTMRANQLRLWFASMAYVLLCALRRIGLKHTQFARASCGTIRLKLLKIGALVRSSVRRIKLAMPTAFPYQAEYRAATIPPRYQPGAMPLTGLAKVETNRFNPQPALSSRTRPAGPARRSKINPVVRIPR